MIDIYNIPLYYIGFHKNPKLENTFKQVGFKNINHFQAIDGRKMNPKNLLTQGTISIRAYSDLIYGREEHTGISSLGTIGCTLSHLELWKKCALGLPYILIAEDDVIPKKISPEDTTNIQNALEQPLGCFISTSFKKGEKTLMGLHFYFLSQGAAKQLAATALPIDMQTDSYIGTLNNIGKINAQGYKILYPRFRASSTGDKGSCIKCILPRARIFYIIFILLITTIIIFCIVFFKNWKITQFKLDSCKNNSE